MALRKPLVITWKGNVHKLIVTMAVIDRVESEINIGRILAQLQTNDIRFSHVAKFVAVLLNESEVKLPDNEKRVTVTQEDVYVGMFSGGDITPANLLGFMTNIISAFFPEQKKKDTTTVKTPTEKAEQAAKT